MLNDYLVSDTVKPLHGAQLLKAMAALSRRKLQLLIVSPALKIVVKEVDVHDRLDDARDPHCRATKPLVSLEVCQHHNACLMDTRVLPEQTHTRTDPLPILALCEEPVNPIEDVQRSIRPAERDTLSQHNIGQKRVTTV